MSRTGTGGSTPYVFAIVWLLFTVSLASWWLSVGLTMPGRHSMFVWEGATFIIVLVAGGLTMVVTIHREHRRRQTVETFFMSFTHDLKTSLASVQLQAEGLEEDWPGSAPREPLDRLLRDTVRLQIQLDNSLYVAQPDGRLLTEQIDVSTAVARLAHDWPGLTIEVSGAAEVLADARALDTVVRNVLQNSVIHGRATRVDVRVTPVSSTADRVRLSISDDGRGVPGDRIHQLGTLFARPAETSSTGAGLFVSRRLIGRMQGTMRFRPGDNRGLTVEIELPGTVR